MFKVQRFTADDEEEESGGHDSTSILDSILQRAKSRAGSSSKRARLERTTSTSGGGGGTGGIHEDNSRANPGANRRAKARAAGDTAASGVAAAGRSSAAPSVSEAKHGGVRLLERDSLSDASEGGESEDSDDSDESEDSGEEEEEEEEGMDVDVDDEDEDEEEDEEEEEEEAGTRLEGGATQQAPEAGADGTGDVVGGEGLRPMEEVADEWGLDARLAETLRAEGVKHFFPIQVRVVPDIVATERHSHVQSRDICVSAPTGSGKTLVFVLGVLQALIRRRVARLRALVLLPSRDLAMQVHAVFERYARGTGLRVGLAIGQTNFLEEQLALVGAVALAGNPVAAARASLLRGQGRHTGPPPSRGSDLDWGERLPASAPVGGASEVDIVVATPGRLLDHLEKTPGFTLQHLRYLVIDEADRLLNQSYQGWVEKVIKAAHRREPGTAAPVGAEVTHKDTPRGNNNNGAAEATSHMRDGAPRVQSRRHPPSAFQLDPVTVRGRPLATGDRVRGPTVSTPPLRKLLFSATLTSNPQKLARLDVVNPLIYTAREMAGDEGGGAAGAEGRGRKDGGGEEGDDDDEKKRPSQETRRSNLDEIGLDGAGLGRFSTPATLQENYTVCDSQAKPLVLLSLLREMVGRQTELSVVFTSSVDSTHRLFRLLQLFGGFEGGAAAEAAKGGGEGAGGDGEADSDGGVAEFSSSLGQRQRSHIVRRARAGGIRVIVCSDGMARGMDLDGVGLVVNYDVPSQPKTYVHRVGRTARAGSRGTAVTIAKKGQVKQFLKMRASVDGKRVRLDSSPADQSRLLLLAGRYQRCLQDLKEVLEAERTGELDPAAPVTAVDSA